MWSLFIFTLSSLLGSSLSLYSSNSDVIQLTPANFQSKVIGSDDVWIVEFYAPWCGHCKALVPEYEKAATALKGVVKVGAVNADDHRDIGGKYGVRGFPTIKIFGANKQKPSDYQGGRTADAMVDGALRELKNLVNQRLSGKKSSSGGGGGGERASGDPKDVIELTDSNFDKLVLDSEDMWLVEFYAPWCGHCKNLAPHWAQAASELKGKVKLGALDATVHTVKSSQYGIQGFPTIKYFGPGKKDSSSVEDYDGGRTASDIVNWANGKLAENIPPPEVVQLISEDVLNKECTKRPLCVIAILPNILDCQSECRNGYISMLTKLGEKYKKSQWGWVWAEGAVQTDLESALELGGFGYPALSAVNAKKKIYSNLRGAFSYDGINEFLRVLQFGKPTTATLGGAKIPNVITTEPWDGKDGVLEMEEDIDLSDIELEPLDKDEL